MAGSPTSENSAPFDAAESSRFERTSPVPLDWEVLSMSTMSASTLGLPPQKPHDSETVAEYNDQEGRKPNNHASPSEQETLLMDRYISERDKEHEDVQTLVGPSYEATVGAEGSPVQEEGIPAISSKKKICVLWWKRQMFNWQPQSRKYSVVLSIALVAAVVGITVIGHRLHRERKLNHQLRLEVSSKEEKLNDIMYQVNRMKEAMTGRRRVGVTRNSFF